VESEVVNNNRCINPTGAHHLPNSMDSKTNTILMADKPLLHRRHPIINSSNNNNNNTRIFNTRHSTRGIGPASTSNNSKYRITETDTPETTTEVDLSKARHKISVTLFDHPSNSRATAFVHTTKDRIQDLSRRSRDKAMILRQRAVPVPVPTCIVLVQSGTERDGDPCVGPGRRFR
jgi:hypothetical protein